MKKRRRLEDGTFGPAIIVKDDGRVRASCEWCVFCVGYACTYRSPAKAIPDIKNTPDWCEMREERLREAAEAESRRTR